MTESAISARRRAVGFMFGLLSLVLVLELIEHWPSACLCGGGSKQDRTEVAIHDRKQAWSHHWLHHGNSGETVCPPPADLVFEPEARLDAWGNEMLFLCLPDLQQRLAVMSAGEDQLFGTTDDLSTLWHRHR
jgi:hypothetical protein